MSQTAAILKTFPSISPAAVRQLFPVCERYAYLNSAGVAPTSIRVHHAVSQWTHDLLDHGLAHVERWAAMEAETRDLCAQFLEAAPEEIAFVRSTSQGLGTIATGFNWKDGDNVLVCADEEYPSNVYPWQALAPRGVTMVSVPSDNGGMSVDTVRAHINEHTRMVAVSAVQYASGHKTDLANLGQLCREKGIRLCVDGIQQLGAFPLSPKSLGIHFLAADSHKWMMGLPGIGFLFVDESVCDEVEPPILGWHSTVDALTSTGPC